MCATAKYLKFYLSFLIRASEFKNAWIDGNDEASEGDFIFTDGSPGKKRKMTILSEKSPRFVLTNTAKNARQIFNKHGIYSQ